MAAGNVHQFQADLQKFAQLVEQDVRTVRRKVALDLFSRIVRRTPVDTGRLRGSWFLTDGVVADVQPEGQASYPAGVVKATFKNPFGVSIISNCLPYAVPIEFEGHSKQAPNGMVRISLAELEAEIQSTTMRLR